MEARRTFELRTVCFCFAQARIVICNKSVIKEWPCDQDAHIASSQLHKSQKELQDVTPNPRLKTRNAKL